MRARTPRPLHLLPPPPWSQRHTAQPHLPGKVATWCAASAVLGRVHVLRCTDLVSQMAAVLSMPAFLAAHAGVRLIVVDSMAFHYRHSPVGAAAGEADMAARSRQLQLMMQALHAAATTHNCAVVVVNHVTTKMTGGGEGDGSGGGSALGSVPTALVNEGALPDGTLIAALPPGDAAAALAAAGARLMPALGEVWAHACTIRVMIGWSADGRHRVAQLVKSPTQRPGLASFSVVDAGVRTLREAGEAAEGGGGGGGVATAPDGRRAGSAEAGGASLGAKRPAPSGEAGGGAGMPPPSHAPPAQRRRVGDAWDAGLGEAGSGGARGGGGAGLGLRVSPPGEVGGGGW
jgi:hypothetical protein